MIKYKQTHPHNIYEKGINEELEMIDEAIRTKILRWERPRGKDFYITKDSQYIHTIFQPTRSQSDAMYLFTKFEQIELEKDGDRYFACVYTGTTNPECEYGSELIYFIEAKSFELAISLAVYESIEYFGQ